MATWRPIARDPAEADRIEARVREVAAQLADTPALALEPVSLAGGVAGLALTFAYLDRAWPDAGHRVTAGHYLDRAVAEVAAHAALPSLYSGFSGVAWLMAHVGEQLEVSADACEDVDAAIAELTLRPQAGDDADHDLVTGLVGLGVYGLERRGTAVGARIVEQVLARLVERAEAQPAGLAWRHDGVLDLGMAHGAPGVIAFAARAFAANIAAPAARELIEDTGGWVGVHLQGSVVPYWIDGESAPSPARTAWCYGAPGVAAAILGAGRATGDPWLERRAVEVATGSLGRPLEDTGVADAGLCHGAAGLLHIANRMAQTTNNATLATQALRWLDETLAQPTPEEPGFLTGAAGVALALLATIRPEPPAWDRLLLCDF